MFYAKQFMFCNHNGRNIDSASPMARWFSTFENYNRQMMCLKIFLKHSLVPFARSFRKATFSGF